jgi:hypothetical protein
MICAAATAASIDRDDERTSCLMSVPKARHRPARHFAATGEAIKVQNNGRAVFPSRGEACGSIRPLVCKPLFLHVFLLAT